LLVESSLSLAQRHLFFGRAEWTQKSGEDLDLAGAPIGPSSEIVNLLAADGTYDVGTVALGYTRQFDPYHGWLPGLGARASLNFIPAGLEPYYGQSNPVGFGFTVFASLRPAAMVMGMGQAAPGMGAQPMAGMDHAEMDMPAPAAPDSATMGHAMPQDSSAMTHVMGADTAAAGMGMMSDDHMQGMHEVLMRMMADPVIRERIATDPDLQRMIDDLNRTMGMTMPGGPALEGSADQRALDFIVRLLANPEVEARIHADPRLHELWNDPAVQARLRELR
jgi:hypothetical protein